jgi:hypothetical protein
MKITKEEIVKFLQVLLTLIITGILIWYGFFFIAEIITQKENAAIEKHKAIAEGRVTDRTDYVKGRLVYVEFYRDGIRHETKMSCSDCRENEYYPIAYDSTNISTLVVQQPNLFLNPTNPLVSPKGELQLFMTVNGVVHFLTSILYTSSMGKHTPDNKSFTIDLLRK